MTNFVNLTPHAIVIRLADGSDFSIPASGSIARVGSTPALLPDVVVGGVSIPTSSTIWGDVAGLPAPVDGVIYIVSALVGGRVSGRDDVYGPDSSPAGAIRNDAGHIVAVRGLVKFG